MLYNMQGQDIGSTEVTRDPKSTELEDYTECTDEVQKLLLSKSKRGRELYIYPDNHVVIGNMTAEVRKTHFDKRLEESQRTSSNPSDTNPVIPCPIFID
jgi:hypothetical protein